MCDSFNETLKLQQQDKVRSAFYILQHIHKLNAILKCSVCFELFDKPTKTNCGHVFCKSCIHKHMTFYSDSIAPCPICMQPLAEFKKFSLHLKYEEAAKFVKDVLEHGKNLQKDIEDPPHFKSILQTIEQITSKRQIEFRPMTNFKSDIRFNRILNSRNCLISTNSQVFLSDTSAILSNEAVDDIKTIPQISNVQSEVNPFDLLLNESKGSKPTKTYKPKKTPQKDTTVTTEIEKSLKNRKRLTNSKAFEWLQDNRNNFESLPTQSKSTTNVKVTVPEFDLPSISQDLKLEFHSKSNKNKRLAHSMGGGSSKITQAKTRERHSIAACDNLTVPITIEQFSGDELKTSTKGLQDLELQCLNKMDKEMLQKEGSNKKTAELSKSGMSNKGKNLSNSNLSRKSTRWKDTLNASSSLDKFKDIKKIISKTERKVKKLPVVVNPSPTVCKVVTSTAGAADLGDQPLVIIKKCNLMNNNQPVASGSKRKFDKAHVMDNEIYNFAKPRNKTMTRIDYVNKNNESQELLSFKTPDKRFNKDEKSKRTPGLKIKSSKVKEVDSSDVNRIESEDTNILSKQTKEIEKKRNGEMELESDIDENIFDKLTQSMDVTAIRISTPNTEDDIFNIPTQRLSIEPHTVTSNYDESHKKLEELTLLQLSNEIINRTSELKSTAKVHVSNLMNDILKAINTSLPLNQEMSNMVNDVFVQTSSPITNLVDMAIQTDPSFSSFENNLTEMGIQTDSNSFRKGLYISSTDMFNTPSLADAESQTDFPLCLNCSHQMSNSGTKAPERFILSESFNNLQFETQDIIKDKRNLELHLKSRVPSPNKISLEENRASTDVLSPTCKSPRRTSKRLRSQISTEELFAKDDGFDNIQFDTQEILKDKSNLRVQLTSSNKNCGVESLASSSSSKSPRRTSKRLCKPNVTEQLLEKDDGFDNVQFDTQEILKGNKDCDVEASSPSSSSKSPRRTSKRLFKPNLTDQLLEKNDLFLSPSPRRTSKRLRILSSAKDENFEIEDARGQRNLKVRSQPGSPISSTKKSDIGFPSCDSPRRTSKRLRTQNTPDEELLPKDVKRNKYINEDTSLQFLSDDVVNSNHRISFDDSDYSNNYEECLNNVLKKYDCEDASTNPKIPQVISKTQTAIKECNVIINEACSESIRIENTENLDKTVKYTKQKPSPSTLSILQDEFTKAYDNVSNIVKTSEIPKDVLQLENVELIKEQVPCNLGDNFEEIDMLMEDVANGASESTNIERLPDNAAQIHTKSNNDYPIVVLENIIISKKKDDAITEELNRSDDVFLSDSDVVETTPQKSKIVSCEELLSQAYCNYFAPLVLPPPVVEDSPDVISSLDPPLLSCLNKTFTPPPEFQDMGDPEENLEDSQDVTLKPESNIMQIVHDGKPVLSSVTPDLFMGGYNMITSTPVETSQIISHSLNLSPIKLTCQEPSKLKNAIEAAQCSMITPLNIVKSQTNPQLKNTRPLGSSTPKQQSMLSYVRNTKPRVTCSRLSKSEVAMILALAEKNLITYTTNFNSSVTHLIVNIDKQQCICDHTMKYLCGVSAGIWILGFNWIQECIIREQIVPEEQYEALDLSGIDGPKYSRLNKISNPLFQGYKIFVSPPFQSVVKKDMEDVIVNLGGEVVPKVNDLLKKNGKICIIIAEAKGSSDFDMYQLWLEKLKVVTVNAEWLSRSVGQYEIINLRHFILCSDDTICDLGYPNELTGNFPMNSRSALSNM